MRWLDSRVLVKITDCTLFGVPRAGRSPGGPGGAYQTP